MLQTLQEMGLFNNIKRLACSGRNRLHYFYATNTTRFRAL